MPLVVPGIMSNNNNSSDSNSKDNQWISQLMGKKIGDTSDAMVRTVHIQLL